MQDAVPIKLHLHLHRPYGQERHDSGCKGTKIISQTYYIMKDFAHLTPKDRCFFEKLRIFAVEMTNNQKTNIILALVCAILAVLCVLSILDS